MTSAVTQARFQRLQLGGPLAFGSCFNKTFELQMKLSLEFRERGTIAALVKFVL